LHDVVGNLFARVGVDTANDLEGFSWNRVLSEMTGYVFCLSRKLKLLRAVIKGKNITFVNDLFISFRIEILNTDPGDDGEPIYIFSKYVKVPDTKPYKPLEN